MRTGVMITTVALALISTSASAQADKQIGMRTDENASTLILDVRPNKPAYKVNEAIKIKARVNQPAYVYVFIPDPKTNYVTLLYPEKATDRNLLPKGKWVSLPPKREFFSDAAGKERIFFIASKKPIDMSARYFVDQGFGRAPSDELRKAFADKGIRMRERDDPPATRSDPNQKLLELSIKP